MGRGSTGRPAPMRRTICTHPMVALGLLAAPAALGLGPASARAGEPKSWNDVKCGRYGRDWTEALARVGRRGIGETFPARHDAFLASGCSFC